MTHRIGAKGQVVIPKELRDAAGLLPGAEVDFELDGGRITIEVVPNERVRKLRGSFAGTDLLTGLLEDRAKERD